MYLPLVDVAHIIIAFLILCALLSFQRRRESSMCLSHPFGVTVIPAQAGIQYVSFSSFVRYCHSSVGIQYVSFSSFVRSCHSRAGIQYVSFSSFVRYCHSSVGIQYVSFSSFVRYCHSRAGGNPVCVFLILSALLSFPRRRESSQHLSLTKNRYLAIFTSQLTYLVLDL